METKVGWRGMIAMRALAYEAQRGANWEKSLAAGCGQRSGRDCREPWVGSAGLDGDTATTPGGRGRRVGLGETLTQGAAGSVDFSGTSTSTRSVNLRVSPGRSAPTPTTRLASICPGPSWTSIRIVYSQGASVPGCRIVPSTLSGHIVDWAGLARLTASKRRCR